MGKDEGVILSSEESVTKADRFQAIFSMKKQKIRIQRGKGDDDEKFNFDIQEYKIDPSLKLHVKQSSTQVLRMNDEPTKKKGEIATMALTIEKSHLPQVKNFGRVKHPDPLADEVFENYHKRMVKQETRMINDDAYQSEIEADRLQNILDGLAVASWRTFLPRVTIIKDKTDENEMLSKKKKTEEAINSMLSKYKEMKRTISIHSRRQRYLMTDLFTNVENMYSKVNRESIVGYHSSSDENEHNMDLSEIRKHRRHLRQKKFASSIVLPLTFSKNSQLRYAVIAEPLKAPYVIRLTKSERSSYSDEIKEPRRKFKYNDIFPNQEYRNGEKTTIACTLIPSPLASDNK